MPGGVERIVERPAALWTRLNDHAQSLRMAWDGRAPGQNRLAKRRLPAEYSPALALWLVRLSACRSPGYGGPEGSHACTSCPASTSRKKTRAVPRGGRAAARLHRQPILWALTTPPAGTRKRSIAVQETGRCGSADGSVVTGARLDVRNLAQTPGGHLGAGLPKVLSMVVSRRYEGTHGRLDQAAARLSGGPPDPARPPRRPSPAQARSQGHSAASLAVSQRHYKQLILVKKKYTMTFMKHYGQACAIARALDVVGDRWSLLLVRELTFGPRRYRDLATGLPGIPSNVLAARLKDLQAAGVITRRTLPAPTDVTVYELTGAGRALQPALTELLHWGRRYAPEPSPDDAAQPAWALLGAAGRPTALPDGQTCELRVGPEFFYFSSDAGTLTVRRGPAPDGDAVVTMPADTLYRLVLGQTTVTDAVRHSTVDGDTAIAHRALEPLAAAFTKPAPAM